MNIRFTQYIGLITAVLCLSGSGCKRDSLAGRWEYHEVARFRSPDEKLEAVLISGSAGATTATVSRIYITRAGERVESESDKNLVFTSDHTKELKPVWRDSHVLQIHYEEARIHQFRNFWETTEVRLIPASSDHSLPITDRTRWQ